MESVRPVKQSTYEISSCAVMLAVLILFIVVFLPGCANVTVVKLAEMCYGADGKPAISFVGESGKVDCK